MGADHGRDAFVRSDHQHREFGGSVIGGQDRLAKVMLGHHSEVIDEAVASGHIFGAERGDSVRLLTTEGAEFDTRQHDAGRCWSRPRP